ncbi:muscarinic acetylcholine receptor DM1 isoform X2 [Teleopsis dalmanni]|uniref:muscarinic acetylcholine receptor DM1 isoform X2 n=1 Tax=Teleopsis dalmanni TaxID=139649 RepID=UPI0018CFCAEE|nr:muscarinic acetylcholine receptor DM1 isoform X2 [Teleopsis dalmanni]
MNSLLSFAMPAHGPPSILEPLAPSFKTTTTASTTTSTSSTTTTTVSSSTLFTVILDNLTTAIVFENDTITNHTNYTNNYESRGPKYSISSMVLMGIIAAILSILTVAGNVMVMISFKIDKQLQTISNYFLFSLAIADFAIGLISIPLFAVSTILGYWPLGPHICDTWLALDYLASNASVLNLLIISFDRYFSVTRPLTYRAKRTTNKAAVMIGAAWGISLLLWPPWIYSWPYIEGKRTVPADECYIQFIETNQYITFGTALAAFYFPVTIMCFLYYRIWRETKKRQKDLPNLQAGKKDSSKRSNSSDENTVVNHTGILSFPQLAGAQNEDWRRPRSESSADAESVYMTNMVLDSGYHGMHSRKSSIKSNNTIKKRYSCLGGVKEWCIAWWHSGREDSDDFQYEQEEPSDLGCTSMNVMRDTYSLGGSASGVRPPSILLPDISPIRPPLTPLSHLQDISSVSGPRSLPSNNRIGSSRSVSQDSVYTILIRLPSDGVNANNGSEAAPSIKMIHEDVPMPLMTMPTRRPLPSRDSEFSLPIGRRQSSHAPDVRIPLNAKIIPKPLGKATARIAAKKKKKSQEKRQESKAAKTLSAILLSFIITWTPYNILVLIKPLTTCSDCIPDELWEFFYALCYINSTINPVCYALCNASFRRTYIRILTCKWHTRNREGMIRGVYN